MEDCMLEEREVLRAISVALQDPNFDLQSSTENNENWDSLGELTILTTLAKLTSGKSDEIPDLFNISSAIELIIKLRENGLVK
jgi:hypothetical protein